MDKLKVALLQVSPAGSLENNMKKGLALCRKAKNMGAHIALFPEMFSNGYNIYNRKPEEWISEAIDTDSRFVNSFGKTAKELDMAICITFLEKCETGPKNSLVLFDRFGNRKLHYAKVHTCDFDVERNLTPGDDFYVSELDVDGEKVNVGAMICYDREFPESARILMLKGAEIVLVPNACPMEINRLSQLRGRAYENMMCIATCNYPDTVPDCNGHSNAFDGVVYLPELCGSRDTCILEADGREDIFLAEFDMETVREYRKNEVHGNAYRRPEMYSLLTDLKVEEPFVRSDRRKKNISK